MKNTRKLSIVLVLVMVLMMALTVIPASAATLTGGETLYLKPNSNWTQDNARFAAYFMNSSKQTCKWVSMTDNNGDGVYEVAVPSGSWAYVIFCRMNPSSATNDWNYKWNQTNDLPLQTYSSKNCYTVSAGAWSNGSGSWSYFCNGNHTWNEGTVTKEPTETETGLKEVECSVCGQEKEITLPVTTHECEFGTELHYDGTHHWTQCSCGEKSELVEHTPGTELKYNEENHWTEC